jgi:uncharacterized OsmC-like protein
MSRMDAAGLKQLQAPLKARYREDPGTALVTLTADGELDGSGVACRVREALVACAGVTLRAVATALGIDAVGTVHAEGDLDFRGTLGVAADAPVGFRDIRLTFALDSAATDEQVAKLVELTERYCVVLQTLRSSPGTAVEVRRA